ncbi:MAG: VWA domain-containing protein [Verrucomicrobia bacterium]|nr:VWA domain-containing protein [Verrucomicrobiota bacterium]
MRFADPYNLLLLLLIPLLSWLRGRKRCQPAFLYSSIQLVKGITGLTRSRPGDWLFKLRWLALACLIVALARPQLLDGETKVRANGIAIAVALDLSGSMKAEDFETEGNRVNRLAIAKSVLREFILKRPNDQIGLVAFAGNAYIAAPPTLDHDFLLQNLQRLKLDTIEDGTAIGSALTACLNRLRDQASKSKIIILMTDGQNNAGDVPPLTAADAAQTMGVKIYTIGVGTRGTAPIPQIDVFGRTVYRQINVDIDEQTLEKIAVKTGGNYYRADKSSDLRNIYAEIDSLETTDIEVDKYEKHQELFPWLVLSGLVLFLLELILGHSVWRTLP